MGLYLHGQTSNTHICSNLVHQLTGNLTAAVLILARSAFDRGPLCIPGAKLGLSSFKSSLTDIEQDVGRGGVSDWTSLQTARETVVACEHSNMRENERSNKRTCLAPLGPLTQTCHFSFCSKARFVFFQSCACLSPRSCFVFLSLGASALLRGLPRQESKPLVLFTRQFVVSRWCVGPCGKKTVRVSSSYRTRSMQECCSTVYNKM